MRNLSVQCQQIQIKPSSKTEDQLAVATLRTRQREEASKKAHCNRRQWLTPVIPAIWGADIRKIVV
jgi:hypothetical protein